MRIPKRIQITNIPNDCGLIAAAAYRYLRDNHVSARILNIRYGATSGHTIVVYKSAKRLCTFDNDGSMNFNPETNWKTDPILLAKAWVKANGIKKRVIGAKWQ